MRFTPSAVNVCDNAFIVECVYVLPYCVLDRILRSRVEYKSQND